MKKAFLFSLLLGSACAGVRVQDDPTPPPAPWLEVRLEIEGDRADESYARCLGLARASGIRVNRGATTRVHFDLSDERNELEVTRGSDVVATKILPGWTAEALCTAAFALAIPPELAPTAARMAPPPGCQPVAFVEGAHHALSGQPNEEAALADLSLQAVRQGIHFIALAGTRSPAPAVLATGGQGFRCPGRTVVPGR